MNLTTANGFQRARYTLFFAVALGTSVCATAQIPQTPEGQFVIGQLDSLYSNILHEQREFWVHLPKGMQQDERYPVIYLLDATSHFHAATGLLSLLTQWDMPQSILIGINTSTDRIRDLTPTNVPFHRGHNSATSGGAPDFARFLQAELQPYVNSRYPTENMSTIIGHSTGGLFAIYAYLQQPDLFDNYLAIEPSLWWDDEALVSASVDILSRDDRQDKSLYVAVANSTGIDTLVVRQDTTEATEQLRANLRFHDLLSQNAERLNVQWHYFGTEDHSSVLAPGLYDGLRSLFSWYPFPERWRFNTPARYTADELVGPFYTHFTTLSTHMKREIRPDWQFVNDVGAFMLTGHDAPDKALAYLKLNLHYYPDRSKTHVALGNFYATQGQREEAIHYFERAVALDGNREAQNRLHALIEDN